MVELEREVCALLASGRDVTLDELGGEGRIWGVADALIRSPIVDEILRAMFVRWHTLADRDTAARFIVNTLAQLSNPITLSNSVDLLFEFPEIVNVVAKDASSTLLLRAQNRSNDQVAELAGRALDGALRLALTGKISRYPVLSALSEIRVGEHRCFSVRAARLISVAFEQWRPADLLPSLELIAENPGAESDGAYEMGMCSALVALDRGSASEILTGLRGARQWFARAIQVDEDRSDAEIIGNSLDIILGFAHEISGAELRAKLRHLHRVLDLRRGWLTGMYRSWLAPRADAEAEWVRLATVLEGAAEPLGRSSWKSPEVALMQVLDAYIATRTIRLWQNVDLSAGLSIFVEPRITGSFVREAGLKQHLLDWADDLPGRYQALAREILASLPNSGGGNDPGTGSRWPQLAAFLPDAMPSEAVAVELLDRMNAIAADLEASRAKGSHPVVSQLFTSITAELSSCRDYSGEVRSTFDDLLLTSLRFLRSRQDAQPSTYGIRTEYLFAGKQGSSPPKERALAEDYQQFLQGSDLAGGLYVEVRDLAGGRVDVLVEHGTHRFIAELKREFDDSSSAGIRAYLQQTAQYQDTNVTLGILLILDLTAKTRPPHLRTNAWVEIVPPATPDDLPRYVVVLRVPGNRRVPSDVS